MKQAHRVASRYFWERYARLLFAMSMEQAKVILGFPPYAQPTEQEIAKAWRAKAFENHPDRGGDTQKMVEVNVAKDVLLNTGGSAAWRPEPTPPPPPRPKYERPKVVETVSGKNFNTGTTEIPSGVDWKFISKPEWAGAKGLPGSYVWTAVGVTDQNYVVISVKERKEDTVYSQEKNGLIQYETDWQCNAVQTSRTKPAAKAIPMLIKGACTLFEDGTIGDPPKKFVLCPEGTVINEAMIRTVKFGSGGLPFKDALLASGLVAETDTAVKGRKSVVEMTFKYSGKAKRERVMRDNPDKKTFVMWNYDVFLTVNGKQAQLADDTVENLGKRFFGWVMPWDAVGDGSIRVITKLKAGRYKGGAADALRILADALTSEPSWLVIALEKAAEEWEPESKTATLLRIASSMSLQDAAASVGMTPFNLFELLHG